MGNWIAKAKLKKGAFTKKAKEMHKTVAGAAKQVLSKGSHASGKTKKQAVLAQTFKKMAKRKKK